MCQGSMMASSSRVPSIQLLIKGVTLLPDTEDSKQGVWLSCLWSLFLGQEEVVL